jgi:hypothetical protein
MDTPLSRFLAVYLNEGSERLHAACMHIFPQNGAISCKIMQNRMIARRVEIPI